MGSAVGTSPGRLVETDANYNIIHEWPEDLPGTVDAVDSQFSPVSLLSTMQCQHITAILTSTSTV